MHKKVMTTNLPKYKLAGVIEEDHRIKAYSAVEITTNAMVILKRIDLTGMSSEDRVLLKELLRNHPLNHSPYVLRVMECFLDKDELFIIQRHMDIGHVEMVVDKKPFLSDDFILYVFMQVVYAAKMHKNEMWFWKRVCVSNIWLDSGGKVRICWSSLILEDAELLMECISGWKKRVCAYHDVEECLCNSSRTSEYEETDEDRRKGQSRRDGNRDGFQDKRGLCKFLEPDGHDEYEVDSDEYLFIDHFENLRKIFVELAFRPDGDLECASFVEDLRELVNRGPVFISFKGASISGVIHGFIRILFRNGGSLLDLERYIKKIIQDKKIASDPQKILKFLDTVKREETDSDTSGRYDTSSIMKDASEEGYLEMAFKGGMGVEEYMGEKNNASLSQHESETKSDEGVKIGPYGTREYKKGRFHVCEAVPLAEREKNRQADPYLIRKLFRIINMQSQQISLLVKAVKQSKDLDKTVESKLMELEEQVEATMMGAENYR